MKRTPQLIAPVIVFAILGLGAGERTRSAPATFATFEYQIAQAVG